MALSGCTLRTPAQPGATVQAGQNDYIDLKPGWRLRVVTPILKSGGYRIKSESVGCESGNGTAITLRAAPDFLGYENAFYSVMPHGNGVSVRFASAEIYRDGKPEPQNRPIAPLFELPRAATHVRLVYLVRVSDADHDMAVLAAKRTNALDALTRRLRSDPGSCRDERRTFCSWVPDGIAVTPETQSASGEWVAVR